MYFRLLNIIFAVGAAILAYESSSTENNGLEKGIWLWAGVTKDDLSHVKSIYIHQATLERRNSKTLPILRRQGLGPKKIGNKSLVIVYRLELLPKAEDLLSPLKQDIERWRRKGNNISGIQIDFDSPSRNLEPYIDFLSDLKRILPSELKLSVTGLADWASSASNEQLHKLFNVTDEVVFQLYNGTSPIPHLNQYLRHIMQLDRPFLVGILREQLPQLKTLESSAYYQGYLIFERSK